METIHVEEGAKVSAGQVLAVLKNPTLKGEYDRAKAEHDRAKDEFESIKSLFDKGFVARNEYDTAAYTYDTARLTFEQAKEAYSARQLDTPIRGTVSLRDLRYGEAVTPPKLAFQVVDMSKLKVDLSLPGAGPRPRTARAGGADPNRGARGHRGWRQVLGSALSLTPRPAPSR